MTELSTRYEPIETEAKWLRTWTERDYWRADANSSKPAYTIVIPPPNITGILHMGHALNNTLQDILIRWKRMAGFEALWVPGTDHASIATQYVVERRLTAEGRNRKELGREAFLAEVWKWKEEYGGTIVEQLKLLGCSCDWSRERFTMDEGLSAAVRAVFKRLYDDGLVYKGNYLVNWCPRCQTTLADDEVEHEDKNGKLWFMRYPIQGAPDRFAVVATTRPETMLGDTAVAVNPTDERYADLVGKMVELPFVNRLIPIIADNFVDKNFGTGMVKITPAHDPNDYQAGKRHGLEEINVLTPDGRMNEVAAQFEGLDRYECRKQLVAALDAMGLLEKIEENPQRVGVCYRCNTVIEPYISKQWFVRMGSLVGPAKDAVNSGRIRFTPEARVKEYNYWLDNVRDWPISRQLWWGHRIPAWYAEDGEIFVSDSYTLPDEPRFREKTWTQDPDVLDTWFSSALWPFSTLGWPEETAELAKFYPTDVLITGKEILFFWVARMIITGLYFKDAVPFHDVYFNPVVADEHGKKMSKSKGNALDPRKLMGEYGTDAMRYTLTADATREQYIAFSEKACEANRNFMNKLWNATRFALGNLGDLDAAALAANVPVAAAARAQMRVEDRWILSRYARAVRGVNGALERFEFDVVVKAIYDFFWRDFCDYYLEAVKPRLYAAEPDMAAKAMVAVAIEGVMRLLHPVCPFITEEIWETLRGRFAGTAYDKSQDTLGVRMLAAFESADHLCVATWNDFAPDALIDEAAEAQMAKLQEVLYTVRNIRGELALQPGLAARVWVASADADERALFAASERFFGTLTKLAQLTVCETLDGVPAFGAGGSAGGASVFVELPEEMRAREKARLAAELEKTVKLCGAQAAKLSNESFTSRAPAAVIDKEEIKLVGYQSEVQVLKDKLEQFGA